MKLYKKAAACLLTAAMALSMLTACGGGGNGGNGGNTPSTLPDNPDQIVLPDPGEGGGEGGGEGTETKPTKTLIVDVHSSKLAEFNKKYAGATEFYVELQNVRYGDGNSVTLSIDARFARNGDAFYANRRITLGKNQQQLSDEDLTLKEGKFYNGYRLLRDSKVAVRRTSDPIDDGDDDPSLDSLITSELPSLMWSTKVKVGPTEYYAEVYNIGDYEYTICFTADGKPVYQFERKLNTKQLSTASLYKTIQAGPGTSKGLCKMPSGFKTYTYDRKVYTLTDATGNVFTLKPVGNGSVTPNSFKVYDKSNNDVTTDFEWVRDFLETKP